MSTKKPVSFLFPLYQFSQIYKCVFIINVTEPYNVCLLTESDSSFSSITTFWTKLQFPSYNGFAKYYLAHCNFSSFLVTMAFSSHIHEFSVKYFIIICSPFSLKYGWASWFVFIPTARVTSIDRTPYSK